MSSHVQSITPATATVDPKAVPKLPHTKAIVTVATGGIPPDLVILRKLWNRVAKLTISIIYSTGIFTLY